MKNILLIIALVCSVVAIGQKSNDAIYSGVPWFDDKGNVVSAHGACIVDDKGRFYLFGEKHSDTSNAFAGFTCYSSADLHNWKYEGIALDVQPEGKLGPNRVGERVKVMRCPKTGEYVMYMHVDTLGYRDQYLGYATSSKITGPYIFRGPLLFNDRPIPKWDMGAFQDDDGSGYVMLHGGDIYRLSDDYKTAVEQTTKAFDKEFEAPAIFHKDSLYYFIGSHLSSWEKNDNYYFTAPTLKGPWTSRGIFAPQGSLTWYSQATFVLPIRGSKQTTYMYMGDRWSFPKQASAATYVWQPFEVSGHKLSIPAYREAWKVNVKTGEFYSSAPEANSMLSIKYSGVWKADTLNMKSSDEKKASFTVTFSGRRLAWYSLARPAGGYAEVSVKDSKGREITHSIIDTYCLYPSPSLKYLSPVLPKGRYTCTVKVTGERGNWSDKRKNNYGSTGYYVTVDKLIVVEK